MSNLHSIFLPHFLLLQKYILVFFTITYVKDVISNDILASRSYVILLIVSYYFTVKEQKRVCRTLQRT